MKRFLTMLMAASAIFAMNSCKEDTPVEELDGPSIEWESNPDFSTVDITETMDVNLTIKAPAGIKSFTVKVDSEPLNNGEGLLDGFKLTELDLVNPSEETAFIVTMILGEGQTVADATELNLDLSTLVPLIAGLTTEDGYHSFTLNIVDNNAKSLEKTCRLHRIGEDTPSYAEPTMIWDGNENFDVEELETEMNVKITISAPAGIKSFVVGVDSDVLNPMISAMNNGSTDMDLINGPETLLSLLQGVGIPTGENLSGKTEVTLDLSNLVPMIISTAGNSYIGTGELLPDSNHTFTLTLEDNAGNPLNKTCTFHYTGETASLSVDESSVDLWANTVKLNVSGEVTSVAYREKDTETWIEVKADENGEYIVAPVWNEGQNEAGLTVYTPKAGTGIFAGKTYEFQLNGETVADAGLTTTSGDVIPNGDMSGWSEYENGIYPNAEGNTFWTSGNNGATPELCVNDNGAAKLSSIQDFVIIMDVFAAGNLYTGTFNYTLPAEASFGQTYDWSARPKALKVKYKANIGVIDFVSSTLPEDSGVVKGETIDKARIFAVVTDWNAMHMVKSGWGEPSGMWDPEDANKLEEGAILGYASQYITESTTGESFVELVIPFNWYDTAAKPTEGNYSIVISCAASSLGDYLTGCSTNKLWVDDFEWVY